MPQLLGEELKHRFERCRESFRINSPQAVDESLLTEFLVMSEDGLVFVDKEVLDLKAILRA